MSSPATFRNRLRWLGHRLSATSFFTETLPSIGAKARAYAQLTRFNRPIGTWLLLWPVLWALWLSSNGRPNQHVFIVFVLGVVLTRSAGCAINDYADRNFDGHVQRTRDRPLVTGQLDAIEAVALCIALGLIALGLVMTLNQLTQLLALIGGFMPIIRQINNTGAFDPLKRSAIAGELTVLICAVFVGMCVNSFIQARKARKAAEGSGPV